MNLIDPTADFCKARAKSLTKIVRLRIRAWYKVFRAMGCIAIDAISMARGTVRGEFDRFDLTINFDGPMV